jgi:hypothetical protein
MALFKFGKGKAANLPITKTAGCAYITTDDGKMYIDLDDNTRVNLNATKADYATNADYATSAGSATLATDSTNATNLKDSSYSYTATTIHSGLDAASAKVYTATINASNWSSNKYTYSNTDLRCGTDGNVPPIIYSSSDDFYLITSAAATKGSGIVFTVSSTPTNAINLTIIDMG